LAGIEEVIFCLEQASEQIRQNVYPQLVLTVLTFRIRTIIKKQLGRGVKVKYEP
jgi:hypothetical protein